MNSKRPILYKGERYSQHITKSMGGPQNEPIITYNEAKSNLLKNITKTKMKLSSLPDSKRMPHDIVLSLRLDPGFSAKSNHPVALFKNSELFEIGSRTWRTSINKKTKVHKEGKMIFVRTTEGGLNALEEKLKKEESLLNKDFKLDIRKIYALDTLKSKEQLQGFPRNWKEGRIEAVLHPLGQDSEIIKDKFLDLVGPVKDLHFTKYESGIIFISFKCDIETINKIKDFNPLRSVQPLNIRPFVIIRGDEAATNLPKQPIYTSKSPIIIGVFDGGVVNNKYISNYSENIDLVSTPKDEFCTDHGSAVTSSILYSQLNKYKNSDILPEPEIYVKSFRVLPTEDPSDTDLHSVIDNIERIVPEEKDIRVFNLSLGPRGQILDDNISRFTYALDRLQYLHNVVFCIAVGNDGDEVGYNRIQSPSDSVNGVSVGAYTELNGEKQSAHYSCYGPGREGAKLKPDISAFGGCEQNPFQVISASGGSRESTWGTSFSTPLVTAALGKLIGLSDNALDTLSAKALLIHKARSQNKFDQQQGHGILPNSIEDIINCSDNSYSLIYRGEILPNSYIELEIPWIEDEKIKGQVSFNWTVALCTPINETSTDEYTSGSVAVTLYPNKYKYRFTNSDKTQKSPKSKTVNIKTNPEIAEQLNNLGWKRSQFPVSELGPKPFKDEARLREQNLKWDTVDAKYKKKNKAEDIVNPFFHIHAYGRGNYEDLNPIKYALILTIDTPKSDIDIYPNILSKYTALVPINLQSLNEIMVPVNRQ